MTMHVTSWVLACLVGASLTFVSAPAYALSNCTIASTANVGFGQYKATDADPVDSLGSISYQCSGVNPGDRIAIHLSRGRSGSFQPRAMIGAGSRLQYNLFLDAGRSVIWGEGGNGTSVYSAHPMEGRETSVPIYGRIPPGQNVRVGTYSDLIVVTLNF